MKLPFVWPVIEFQYSFQPKAGTCMDCLADKEHALSLCCDLRCFTLQIVRIPNYSSSPGTYVCFSFYKPNIKHSFWGRDGGRTGKGYITRATLGGGGVWRVRLRVRG